MSWQASQAVRDHSGSTGATRTIALVLATYAAADGRDVRPSLATICQKAKVAHSTASRARKWLVEKGEAEVVGYWPTQTGDDTPILSFAPLLEKGSEIEHFEDEKGSEIDKKGSLSDMKGSEIDIDRSEIEHESKEKGNRKDHEKKGLPVSLGVSGSSVSSGSSSESSFSSSSSRAKEEQQHVEEAERKELRSTLEAQLKDKPNHGPTLRALESVQNELGGPTA